MQETGRSGRDGECTIAVLYYGKSDGYSDKLSAEMKHYINNSVVCRRELLMSTFGDPSQVPQAEEVQPSSQYVTNSIKSIDALNPPSGLLATFLGLS